MEQINPVGRRVRLTFACDRVSATDHHQRRRPRARRRRRLQACGTVGKQVNYKNVCGVRVRSASARAERKMPCHHQLRKAISDGYELLATTLTFSRFLDELFCQKSRAADRVSGKSDPPVHNRWHKLHFRAVLSICQPMTRRQLLY
jgi:hypothetical protein